MNITLSIPDELNNWFDDYCKRKGTKKSTYINFLLEQKKQYDEEVNSTGPIQPETPVIPESVKVAMDMSTMSESTQEDPFSIEAPKKIPPIDEWGNEITREELLPQKSAAREKLAKVVSKLKAPVADRCVHGIAKGGYCKACGGNAK